MQDFKTNHYSQGVTSRNDKLKHFWQSRYDISNYLIQAYVSEIQQSTYRKLCYLIHSTQNTKLIEFQLLKLVLGVQFFDHSIHRQNLTAQKLFIQSFYDPSIFTHYLVVVIIICTILERRSLLLRPLPSCHNSYV